MFDFTSIDFNAKAAHIQKLLLSHYKNRNHIYALVVEPTLQIDYIVNLITMSSTSGGLDIRIICLSDDQFIPPYGDGTKPLLYIYRGSLSEKRSYSTTVAGIPAVFDFMTTVTAYLNSQLEVQSLRDMSGKVGNKTSLSEWLEYLSTIPAIDTLGVTNVDHEDR